MAKTKINIGDQSTTISIKDLETFSVTNDSTGLLVHLSKGTIRSHGVNGEESFAIANAQDIDISAFDNTTCYITIDSHGIAKAISEPHWPGALVLALIECSNGNVISNIDMRTWADTNSIHSRNLADYRVQVNGGLTIEIVSGRLIDASTNTIIESSPSTFALSDDTTYFVELKFDGDVDINTSNFTPGRIPLAVVTTSGGAITNIEDQRAWLVITTRQHSYNETPSGTIDGNNTDFIIQNTPITNSVRVYGGATETTLSRLAPTAFTINGTTITFDTAPSLGTVLLVDYEYSIGN